jgi:bacillithiol system protein YtxJ
MANALVELRTIDDLNDFLASAQDEPVLLYKHSLTCGTSGWAMEEVRELLGPDGPGVRIGLVLVQAARDVSNDIARRFSVRHESPQLLLVHEGNLAWSASHYRVTAQAAAEALGRLRPVSR